MESSMNLISSTYSDDDFAPSPDAEGSHGSQAMDLIMDEPKVGEPKAKCSDEQQKRINKFLSLKQLGKSYNAEVRNKKEYQNPDFLRHAVAYEDIDEIGSCFKKEVFDPHGYDKSDFYDEIALPTATACGLRPLSAAVDSTTRDDRNKKSKWDKGDIVFQGGW